MRSSVIWVLVVMANNYAGNEYKRGILAFFHAMRTLFGQTLKSADSSDIDGTHSSKNGNTSTGLQQQEAAKSGFFILQLGKKPSICGLFFNGLINTEFACALQH